jgi:hypothetical protein
MSRSRVVQLSVCLTAAYIILSHLSMLLPSAPAGNTPPPLPVRNLLVSLLLVGGVGAAVFFVAGRLGLGLGRMLYGAPAAPEDEAPKARGFLSVGLMLLVVFWLVSRATSWEPDEGAALMFWRAWPVIVTAAFLCISPLLTRVCIWGARRAPRRGGSFTFLIRPGLVALGFYFVVGWLPRSVTVGLFYARHALLIGRGGLPVRNPFPGTPLIGVAAGLALMLVPGHLARFLSGRWLDFSAPEGE